MQSLGREMQMNKDKVVQYLQDAIPLGPHERPEAEWIPVRLDVVQRAIALLGPKGVECRQVCTVALHVDGDPEDDEGLDQDSQCPACGEDGGTRCGLPNCEY
jgi:hypothetical protein